MDLQPSHEPAHDDPPVLHARFLQRRATTFIPADSIVGIFPTRHFPTIPWHDHDFYELAVIESGRGFHESDHGSGALEPGTTIFVPPGVGHEYRGCEDLRVYNCLFRAELLDGELMWVKRDPSLGALFDPDAAARQHASGPVVTVTLAPDIVQRVIETLEPIRTGEASTRASQLARLLLALDIMATAHAAASRREIAVSGTPTLVTDAIELMSSDLAFPWTLDELSRRIFVGRFHLARVFARAVGEPPMHYLARLRAERAAAMLVSTDLPVAVVGTKVGWPDPAYFSRRFRATFGVSPRTYRTQHGAGSPAPPRLVNGVQELRKGGQVAS